jgi:tyrosinase
MYQSAHPDRYFKPQNIGAAGNVFLENGQTVDADTPLLPFRQPSGEFWTTNAARDTDTFGYAYPETLQAHNTSATQARIAHMYGSSARNMLTAPHGAVGFAARVNTFTDWTINAKARVSHSVVARFRLGGDGSSDGVDVGSWVRLMPASHTRDRTPTSTPKTCTSTSTQKTYASTSTHSIKRDNNNDNNNDNNPSYTGTDKMVYNGGISLTPSLLSQIAAGKLKSLNVGDVVPYLRECLEWVVLDVRLHLLKVGGVATNYPPG